MCLNMHVLPDMDKSLMPYEFDNAETRRYDASTPAENRVLLTELRQSFPDTNTVSVPFDDSVPAVNQWHQHIRDRIMDRQAQGDRIADHIASRNVRTAVQQLINKLVDPSDIEIDLG